MEVFTLPHQGPEHRENSRRPQYEQATQRLGVVGLRHLDDSEQSFDSRSPQVTHVKALQIHQASPATGPTQWHKMSHDNICKHACLLVG